MSDESKRAWDYYQHADNLQHQRHNIFIVAQSIFFAAFAQDPCKVGPVVATVGMIYALLWWWLSERLSDGMNKLRDEYLKPNDKIYVAYLDGLYSPRKLPRQVIPKKIAKCLSGQVVLNIILPVMTFVAWVILLIRA